MNQPKFHWHVEREGRKYFVVWKNERIAPHLTSRAKACAVLGKLLIAEMKGKA